jgi:L-lactate dehydrogenase complex protein LldF
MIALKKEFSRMADRISRDLRHRGLIQRALGGYYVKRDEFKSRYPDWQAARQAAAERKWEVVNHLDQYLAEFADKLEARGAQVFWAPDGASARDYVLKVARENGVKSIIKSKTMTSEEIHLNDALEKAGFKVTESDLGEYIVQLRHEPPYHFVFPAMHLTREEISQLFEKELGTAPTDSPEELTMIARRVMRKLYASADMGISGANFGIAETGMISITENEGNARLTTALPRIHIALMGIEKILPKLSDLALFLPMLATSGAGQPMTAYNTMYAGPRAEGEVDGPEDFHLILLDNRRTAVLADPEQRDSLHCIRCGACLNVCPIFKNVGGHTYGSTYQGPIGSVITPNMAGLQSWKHLSFASSLCGACTEACPVKIDLHHHLLQNRRNAIVGRRVWWEKGIFKVFQHVMVWPELYATLGRLGRWVQPLHVMVKRSWIDPVRSWTGSRDLPKAPRLSFRDEWKRRGGSKKS